MADGDAANNYSKNTIQLVKKTATAGNRTRIPTPTTLDSTIELRTPALQLSKALLDAKLQRVAGSGVILSDGFVQVIHTAPIEPQRAFAGRDM